MFNHVSMSVILREVGGQKLTVGTRLVKELTEFSGDLSLDGLHFWKTAFSAMTHPATTIASSSQAKEAAASEASKHLSENNPSPASGKKIVLLPCKSPPSRERVQLWLEARKQYELLLKGRRATGMEDSPDRDESAVSSRPAVDAEQCQRFFSSRAQKRKKHNLSLVTSPVRSSGSQCNSAEVSPSSDDNVTVNLEPDDREKDDDDDDDDKTCCSDSPELPPWQQPPGSDRSSQDRQSETSPEPTSPRIVNCTERLEETLSPTLLRDREPTSPHLLHSTPFLRRRQGGKEDLEPVCSTPISVGKKAEHFSIRVIGHCGHSSLVMLVFVSVLLQMSLFLRDYIRGGGAKRSL